MESMKKITHVSSVRILLYIARVDDRETLVTVRFGVNYFDDQIQT